MTKSGRGGGAYSVLGRHYTYLMGDTDYAVWCDFYLQIAGISPRTAIDCACGTGLMTIELKRRGVDVIGADVSEQMLEAAQQNALAHGVYPLFVRQDMRNIGSAKKVDLVTCCCDGVNYLLSDDDVKSFFSGAYSALGGGGCLVFDISSEYKLTRELGNNVYYEDHDEFTYIWHNRLSAEKQQVAMELIFFEREGETYRRREERHVQRIYTPEKVEGFLATAGFSDIRVYGDKRSEPPRPDEKRIHFAARKA